MEQQLHIRIDDLRSKSRTMINRLQEATKRVNNEMSLLRSQSLLSNNLPARKSPDNWRMRNYSGQVGGTLCPEYFHFEHGNRNRCFVGKVGCGKIVIPSKSHSECKLQQRKGVKECYCYSKTSRTKICTKKNTINPTSLCDYCKSNFNVEISMPIVETSIAQESELPLLNSETLKKTERITYSPTSEFLRRVKKKCCIQQKPNSNYSEFSIKSSSKTSGKLTQDSGRGESSEDVRCRGGNYYGSDQGAKVKTRSDISANNENQPRAGQRQRISLENNGGERNGKMTESSRRSNSARINVITIDDKKSENVTGKPRASLRKTIRSAECLNDNQLRKQRSCIKNSPKKIVRTISTHSRCFVHDDLKNVQSKRIINRTKSNCQVKNCSEALCCGTGWQLYRDNKDEITPTIDNDGDKVRELNKFRNDNYFDTHGSTQTLFTSSRSSGSIQQYVLNDRLFPEAVGKIHRDDFVVTMPPTATKQKKRIHYFPKHIVTQDKNRCNTNYNKKKRRSQSCSLTGHAVDLGILKKPYQISNSLALRYQKGVVMADKRQQINYYQIDCK